MPYVTQTEQLLIDDYVEKVIQQNILKTARKSVIQVLKVRFGDIPPPVAALTNKIDDPGRLELLLEKAITVESVEQFERILQDTSLDKANQGQTPPDLSR